jgi:hypothetical protein
MQINNSIITLLVAVLLRSTNTAAMPLPQQISALGNTLGSSASMMGASMYAALYHYVPLSHPSEDSSKTPPVNATADDQIDYFD